MTDMNTEREVIEGEVLGRESADVDEALVERALALPGAQDVALPSYFEALRAALDRCIDLDKIQPIRDRVEEAMICARRLKDASIMEKAIRITAETNRKLGQLMNEIPEGKPGIKSSTPTRMEIVREAGISISAAQRASNIATIPEKLFRSLVDQPGSASLSTLEKVARAQRIASHQRHYQDSKQRVDVEKKFRDFSDFIRTHSPGAAAKLFGSERRSMERIAMKSRDWLEKFILALSDG
jgi:hypothetical protein